MRKLKVTIISVLVLSFWNFFKKDFWNIFGSFLLKQGTDFDTLNYNSNMYGYVDAVIMFAVAYYFAIGISSKSKNKDDTKTDISSLQNLKKDANDFLRVCYEFMLGIISVLKWPIVAALVIVVIYFLGRIMG
jgi:hypothetical protein